MSQLNAMTEHAQSGNGLEGGDPAILAEKALREAIEKKIELVESTLMVAGIPYRWFKVADPDKLLTAAVENQDRPSIEVDPFWSVMWRAAQGIDAFLCTQELRGVRILELGCGAGQAGIAAAIRGAKVTLSDAVELALQVAQLNAWPVRDRVEFRQLRWGQDLLSDAKFPIIIGSDIVYDPNHFPQLEQCARSHLATDGRLLLTEPHRHTGDRFASWILEAGWHCKIHNLDLQDGRIAMRLFECWL